MSSLNENMDEIIRNAAENYPLKISGADFNKLLKKMEQQPIFNNESSYQNYKKIYWLLFCLIFFWVCNDNRYSTLNPLSSLNTNHLLEKEYASVKEIIKINKKEKQEATINQKKLILIEKHNHKLKDTALTTHTQYELSEIVKRNVLTFGIPPNKLEQKNSTEILPINSFNDNTSIVKPITPNSHPSSKKNKKFYVGLLAGPDFSTVKMQEISNTGFDLGFIAGFEINKNWSIVTGFLKNKKFYYSDGEYFSRKNLTTSASIKILNVNGNCNMLEMPINIQYAFKNNNHSAWFASAGITSYFMKSESYTYMYNNNGSVYPRTKDYNNTSEFWASAITLGIGKKFFLNKSGELKIQPLIEIPIKHVGIGELPITSASIQFSFTKKIF